MAEAFAGMTVLKPSPVYPPQIPLISRVGRSQSLSIGANEFYPPVAAMPKSHLYFFSSKWKSILDSESDLRAYNMKYKLKTITSYSKKEAKDHWWYYFTFPLAVLYIIFIDRIIIAIILSDIFILYQ